MNQIQNVLSSLGVAANLPVGVDQIWLGIGKFFKCAWIITVRDGQRDPRSSIATLIYEHLKKKKKNIYIIYIYNYTKFSLKRDGLVEFSTESNRRQPIHLIWVCDNFFSFSSLPWAAFHYFHLNIYTVVPRITNASHSERCTQRTSFSFISRFIQRTSLHTTNFASSKNPRIFKKNNVIKSKLPVHWKSNQKAWVIYIYIYIYAVMSYFNILCEFDHLP